MAPTRQLGLFKPTSKSKINGRDKALITQLATLLDNNWEESDKVTAFLASCKNDDTGSKVETETDPLHILATAIHKANAGDASEFTSSTQLDIKEPETYKQAMYGSHGQQKVQAIKDHPHVSLEKDVDHKSLFLILTPLSQAVFRGH